MARAATSTSRRERGPPRVRASDGHDPEHGLEDDEQARRRAPPCRPGTGPPRSTSTSRRPAAAGPDGGRRPLEAAALHRVGALDVDEVEDGRRDVDEGDEAGPPGASRTAAGRARRPAAPQAGDREVDPAAASGTGPTTSTASRSRSTRASSRPPARRCAGGRRGAGAPAGRRSPAAGSASARAEVGGLDQHHATGRPDLVEGGSTASGRSATPNGAIGSSVDQRRPTPPAGTTPSRSMRPLPASPVEGGRALRVAGRRRWRSPPGRTPASREGVARGRRSRRRSRRSAFAGDQRGLGQADEPRARLLTGVPPEHRPAGTPKKSSSGSKTWPSLSTPRAGCRR